MSRNIGNISLGFWRSPKFRATLGDSLIRSGIPSGSGQSENALLAGTDVVHDFLDRGDDRIRVVIWDVVACIAYGPLRAMG